MTRPFYATSIMVGIYYELSGFIYAATPREVVTDVSSVKLWAFTLLGVLASNLRGIAISTLVTI